MRKHRILEEKYGLDRKENIPENYVKWDREDKKCGFSACETWDLDYSFICWLTERVERYKEVAERGIDLTFNTFQYKGKKYTQKELINLLLKQCEKYFSNEDDYFPKTLPYENEIWNEINDIWKVLGPSMWW